MKSIDNEILLICAKKVYSVLVRTYIGIIFGSFLFSYSRNIKIKDELFSYILLGFVLTMFFLILYILK